LVYLVVVGDDETRQNGTDVLQLLIDALGLKKQDKNKDINVNIAHGTGRILVPRHARRLRGRRRRMVVAWTKGTLPLKEMISTLSVYSET
jgi:hypothetical protein